VGPLDAGSLAGRSLAETGDYRFSVGQHRRRITKELPLPLTAFAPVSTARRAAPATSERYAQAPSVHRGQGCRER
jgi:hypothetical protein